MAARGLPATPRGRRGLAWAAPRVALWLVAMGVVVASAWVCDDAFITLRSVDNLLAGRGLTFNPHWRVQSFTHPAWMLLLVATRLLVHEPFFALLTLCLLCSGATLGLLLGATRRLGGALTVVFCLAGSRALVEYSTSGLENSLLHLLLAAAALAPERDDDGDARRVGRAVLLASCAALCRPDAMLLFAPLALAATVAPSDIASSKAGDGRRRGFAVALGLTPLLVWLAFAVLYFGHPLPNTALAKLGGVPASHRWEQGLWYLWVSAARDPGTALLCLAAVALPWLDLRDASPRRVARRWLSIGCVLHLAYVVYIGGDFMEGRFLTAPALLGLVSVVTLADAPGHRAGAFVGVAASLPLLAALGSRHPLRPRAGWDERPHVERGVADERAHYRRAASLHALDPSQSAAGQLPRHRWRELGEAGPAGGGRVAVFSTMGYYAYFSAPQVHVVDGFALADPLLARLPALERIVFRPGHSSRPIPDGYLETLESGRNELRDADLEGLYRDLERLHTGPLFGGGRAAAMWRVWTGKHRIDEQRYRLFERSRVSVARLARRRGGRLSIRDAGVVLEMEPGVTWRLETNPGRFDVGCEGGAARSYTVTGPAKALVELEDLPQCDALVVHPRDMMGRRSTQLVVTRVAQR